MWLLSTDLGLQEVNTGVRKVYDKTFIDSNGANFNFWAGGAETPRVFAAQSSPDEVSKSRISGWLI